MKLEQGEVFIASMLLFFVIILLMLGVTAISPRADSPEITKIKDFCFDNGLLYEYTGSRAYCKKVCQVEYLEDGNYLGVGHDFIDLDDLNNPKRIETIIYYEEGIYFPVSAGGEFELATLRGCIDGSEISKEDWERGKLRLRPVRT